MNDQLTQLEQQVQELIAWKSDREKQQIVYPLDYQSQVILGKYFMRILSSIVTIGGVGGHEFITYLGQQGLFNFQVSPNNLISYTVNPATEIFTVSNGNFQNDDRVNVSTSDTPPSPLDTVTQYYVINAATDGRSFKLSTSMGGTAINITDSGTGLQYIYFTEF